MISRVVELVGFALIIGALWMVSHPLAIGVGGLACLLVAVGLEDAAKTRKRAEK